MKNLTKSRYAAKRRNIQSRLAYLNEMYKQKQFGVCEGIILGLQNDLTLLYGLMLKVQDEK